MEEKLLDIRVEQEKKEMQKAKEESERIRKQAIEDHEKRCEKEIIDEATAVKVLEANDSQKTLGLLDRIKELGGMDEILAVLHNFHGR